MSLAASSSRLTPDWFEAAVVAALAIASDCVAADIALCTRTPTLASALAYASVTFCPAATLPPWPTIGAVPSASMALALPLSCLLYTSDAADEEDSVDLGGRRII